MTKVERGVWLSTICCAISAGLYFRFIGFYDWPLAVDEYYLYKSITFILDSGLPRFPCGGYYARGLMYQYLTAPLLYFGYSAEASLRVVSILSNLAMLPAAYLLALRIGGFRVAAVVLIILSLSTWEIEMSRFGRMYAPFQAIFMWYVYHAYQLSTTQDLKRWRWLFALSIVGPFVWEGAIFLALFNFLPLLIDRKCSSRKHIFYAVVVLVAIFAFLQTDFRFLDSGPSDLTAGAVTNASATESSANSFTLLLPMLSESPIQLVIFGLLLVLLAIFTSRALFRAAFSKLEIFVLIFSCMSLVANQILLTAFILIGASLAGWIRPQTFRTRETRQVAIIMLVVCLYFFLTAIFSDYAPTLSSRLRVLIAFPDILYSFVYPWLFNIPIMMITFVVSAFIVTISCLTDKTTNARGLRLILLFVLSSIAVLGIAPTMYQETRYSFFLYPLLICITGYAVYLLSCHLKRRRRPFVVLAPASFILLFLISSDFSVAHLAGIDKYDANFRIGYTDRRARHYYPRMDFKGPSDFVNANVGDTDSVIISSVVFSNYVENPDYVYLDQMDGRFDSQVCPGGHFERWTNLPLLKTISEVTATIRAGRSQVSWIVVDQQVSETPRWADFLQDNLEAKEVYRSPDNRISVYVYSGG